MGLVKEWSSTKIIPLESVTPTKERRGSSVESGECGDSKTLYAKSS